MVQWIRGYGQKDFAIRNQKILNDWCAHIFSSREPRMRKIQCSVIIALAQTSLARNTIELHGSGTTNPSKCLWSIMERFEEKTKEPLHMTYRAIGSGPGQTEFLGADNGYAAYTHFGSGDIPISADDYAALNSNTTGMLHIPFVLGAISVFHSIPGVPDGVGGLNVTECLLARIFNRDITTWDHPDIVEFNPNMNLPSENYPINVAHRVEGSSSTASLTAYLRASCPEHWTEDMTGKEITWPEDTMACDGSALMAACISDNPGTIGYTDSGHGHSEGLIEIELRNYDQNFLSSRTAAANGGIASAATSLPQNADDFSGVDLLNQPGEYTWPIVALSYIYVRQDLSYMDVETQGLLKAFLTSLFDRDFNSACDEFGFVTVSDEVRTTTLAAIENLQVDAASPVFSFETEEDTQVITGTADYVVSGKRRSYAEYERSVNEGKIADLEAEVVSLRSTITSLESQMNSGTGGDSDTSTSDEARAALGLSILNTIFWACALIWSSFLRPKVVHKNVDDGSLVSDLNIPEGSNANVDDAAL